MGWKSRDQAVVSKFRLRGAMLCDYQPHPVRFVWSFLFAGLLRGYSDALALGLGRRYLELCALGLAVDAAGFRLFLSCFAWWGWQSIGRTVAAWLLSLLVCALARAAALAVLLGRRIPSVQLSALASSAAGSSLLLTLSMLVLKQELDERGKGPDAAAYAWHICTFALGLGALLAPSRGPEPSPPAEAAAEGLSTATAAAPSAAESTAAGAPDPWPAALQLLLEQPARVAPFGLSALVIGACGVPPALLRRLLLRRLAASAAAASACTRPGVHPPRMHCHATVLPCSAVDAPFSAARRCEPNTPPRAAPRLAPLARLRRLSAAARRSPVHSP